MFHIIEPRVKFRKSRRKCNIEQKRININNVKNSEKICKKCNLNYPENEMRGEKCYLCWGEEYGRKRRSKKTEQCQEG